MDTPILFLVFNRPLLTKIVFDEIRKVKPSRLFIAIDGPRLGNLNDVDNINKIINIVTHIDWECKLEILKRDKNLGCGLAVSSAIDWFFSIVEEGIILEDDCFPSSEFFLFCSEMLNLYRGSNEIISINGFNPESNIKYINESYTFTSYNLIWGWATWKCSWDLYNYDLSRIPWYERLLKLFFKFKFDFVSIRSWHKHINLVIQGKINTWDYQWIYTALVYNRLVITPKNNLIENIGNYDSPTNGYVNAEFMEVPIDKFSIFPLKHPTTIRRNKYLDKKLRINRFGNSLLLFTISKYKQIKNKLWE